MTLLATILDRVIALYHADPGTYRQNAPIFGNALIASPDVVLDGYSITGTEDVDIA